MSTAEAMRDEAAPPREPAPPQRAHASPSSPGVASAWLLRTAAFAAAAAGFMGVVVAPGLRGNAGESAVKLAESVSATLGYFLAGALIALFLRGALELVRAREVATPARVALVGAGSAVVLLSSFGLRDRVPPPFAVLLAAAAAVASLVAAYAAARGPHTRAIAGVLFLFAFAAIVRLGAWELAMRAGDTASLRMFGHSRALATAGVLLEAAGQLLAATWLGSRSRSTGQLGTVAAVVGAAVLTWGVAKGGHSDASWWQAVMHTALGGASGVPPPYGLDALATFLVPASLLLALVVAAQPRQVVAVIATMALALVSRGAFDAPLRALCAVVAAQWAVLACVDERAMWRTLIDDRARRIAEDGALPGGAGGMGGAGGAGIPGVAGAAGGEPQAPSQAPKG